MARDTAIIGPGLNVHTFDSQQVEADPAMRWHNRLAALAMPVSARRLQPTEKGTDPHPRFSCNTAPPMSALTGVHDGPARARA